jgi:hypothetical protein
VTLREFIGAMKNTLRGGLSFCLFESLFRTFRLTRLLGSINGACSPNEYDARTEPGCWRRLREKARRGGVS